MQPVASTPTSGNTIPTDPNLQPQAEAFRQEIAAKFGITNIGGYREGDPEDHGKGLAVDGWFQQIQSLEIKLHSMRLITWTVQVSHILSGNNNSHASK